MNVWVVRAGRSGEFEEFALQESTAVIGFDFPQSVAEFADRDELLNTLRNETRYQDLSIHKVMSAVSQLWKFAKEIQPGDMILMPRKSPKVISVGQAMADYQFRPDLADSLQGAAVYHTRGVEWEAPDVPRFNFDQDLLNSINGQLTVFQVRKEVAEVRINQIVKAHLSGEPIIESEDEIYISDDEAPESDLDEQIEDRIVQRIRQRFSGTRLEYLVAEILKASGYNAVQARLGPDGGIDVVAGMGEMGFGEPRLCVQVKSGGTPVGLPDYNRLQGNIRGFGAQYGLLVSLSDFTSVVRKENERSFFEIRLWGAGELVENLLKTYDSLPAEIQADVPLENRRVLVESED